MKLRAIDQLICWCEKIESENLDEVVNEVERFEDAAAIIREDGEIIRTKKSNIICIAYQQGKVFKKFKKNKKYI